MSTSSDVTPATSSAYTVTAAQSVSGVGVTITPPTSAAGGLTTYAVTFTTSSTGALDGNAGSTVTIALPANTGLGSFNNGSYQLTRRRGHPGRLLRSHRHQQCHSDGDLLRGRRGHRRRLDDGHGHPHRGDQSAGRLTHPGRVDQLGLTPVTSPAYTVTAAQPVSGVGVTITPPDLGGRRADHLRGHLHHLVDRRPGRQRREHRHHRPAGQHRPRLLQQREHQLTRRRGHPGRLLRSHRHQQPATPTVTCYVDSGDTVGASTTVTATLTGVTNPPAGSPTLAVSTTSDVTPVTSPSYTVTAARSVSQPAVSLSNADRTEHVHLPGHLQDLVHRGTGR